MLRIMILFFTFNSSSIKGQVDPETKKDHSVSYYLATNWLKEEILIPKVHKGILNSIEYTFEKCNNHFWSIQFDIGYGKLKTELESEVSSQNGQIKLDFFRGYNIWGTEKISYFLGYNVKYSWEIMDFPVWDESRAYWSTSMTIGPYNRFNVELKNGNQWISSLDFSLTGIISRPDEVRLYAQEKWSFFSILKTTNSGFRPGFLNSILLIDFKTDYRIPGKKGQYISIFYIFLYSRTNKNTDPSLFISRNCFGLTLGF